MFKSDRIFKMNVTSRAGTVGTNLQFLLIFKANLNGIGMSRNLQIN